MVALLDAWLARRPSSEDELRGVEALRGPREVASLLGHLVFSCEAVPRGRTYMQAMLRQFAGLVVDWARGAVRYVHGGSWRDVHLSSGFWRDLAWWRSALSVSNCRHIRPTPLGTAAIAGTDASGYACGELVWIDGQREEMVLRFTRAERRRHINYRELMGVV